MVSPESSSVILHQRRRAHYELPDLKRRGTQEVPGVVRASASSRRSLLSVLGAADEEHLDDFWKETIQQEHDQVRRRSFALRRGVALQGGNDPLFRSLARSGITLTFLNTFADRLFEILDFFESREGEQILRWKRQRRDLEHDQSRRRDELQRALHRAFSAFPSGGSLGGLQGTERLEILEAASDWLLDNDRRDTHELIFRTLEQLKADASLLRQFLEPRPAFAAHISHPRLGPEDPRIVTLVGRTLKLLPFGDMPHPEKEREEIIQGDTLRAYLLLLLSAGGTHLVFELPRSVTTMILDQKWKLRSRRNRPLLAELHQFLLTRSRRQGTLLQRLEAKRSELRSRERTDEEEKEFKAVPHRKAQAKRRLIMYRLLSRILFQRPVEALTEEMPPHGFTLNRGDRMPHDRQVYSRVLAFYYVLLLLKNHKNLLVMDRQPLTLEQLVNGLEVSIRHQTGQEGHVRSRQVSLDIEDHLSGNPGRLASFMGTHEHSVPPGVVFFSGMNEMLVLKPEAEPPEKARAEAGAAEEEGQTEAQNERMEEVETEAEEEPEPREEALIPEEMPSADRLSLAEQEQILQYRMPYAAHFSHQIYLARLIRELGSTDQMARLRRHLHIRPVTRDTFPNPYREAEEWLKERRITAPIWDSVPEHELPEGGEGYDFIELSVTARSRPDLLFQAERRLNPRGTIQLCFPIEIPDQQFLAELGKRFELTVLKSSGEPFDENCFRFISAKRGKSRFIDDFHAYMRASTRAVSMVRLVKREEGGKAQETVTPRWQQASGNLLSPEEIGLGQKLSPSFHDMKNPRVWRSARTYKAHQTIDQVLSRQLRLKTSPAAADQLTHALSILEQETKSGAAMDKLNHLLIAICQTRAAAEGEVQGKRDMTLHEAYDFSYRILHIYLASDQARPPVLLAFHPDKKTRELYFEWLLREENRTNGVLANAQEVLMGHYEEASRVPGIRRILPEREGGGASSIPAASEVRGRPESERLFWFSDHLASGTSSRQEIAVRSLRTLSLEHPELAAEALDRHAEGLAADVLLLVASELRSAQILHHAGTALFSRLAAAPDLWGNFTWEEMGRAALANHRLIWVRAGLGLGRLPANPSTRKKTRDVMNADPSFPKTVLAEGLNAGVFRDDHDSSLEACRAVMAEESVFDGVNRNGFEQLSQVILRVPAQKKPFVAVIRSRLDQGKPVSREATVCIDRFLGTDEQFSERLISITERYLIDISDPVAELLPTKGNMKAYLEEAISSGTPHKTACYQELKRRIGEEPATLLRYCYARGTRSNGHSAMLFHEALENPAQRAWLDTLVDLLASAKDPELTVVKKEKPKKEPVRKPPEEAEFSMSELLKTPSLLDSLPPSVTTVKVYTDDLTSIQFEGTPAAAREHLAAVAKKRTDQKEVQNALDTRWLPLGVIPELTEAGEQVRLTHADHAERTVLVSLEAAKTLDPRTFQFEAPPGMKPLQFNLDPEAHFELIIDDPEALLHFSWDAIPRHVLFDVYDLTIIFVGKRVSRETLEDLKKEAEDLLDTKAERTTKIFELQEKAKALGLVLEVQRRGTKRRSREEKPYLKGDGLTLKRAGNEEACIISPEHAVSELKVPDILLVLDEVLDDIAGPFRAGLQTSLLEQVYEVRFFTKPPLTACWVVELPSSVVLQASAAKIKTFEIPGDLRRPLEVRPIADNKAYTHPYQGSAPLTHEGLFNFCLAATPEDKRPKKDEPLVPPEAPKPPWYKRLFGRE